MLPTRCHQSMLIKVVPWPLKNVSCCERGRYPCHSLELSSVDWTNFSILSKIFLGQFGSNILKCLAKSDIAKSSSRLLWVLGQPIGSDALGDTKTNSQGRYHPATATLHTFNSSLLEEIIGNWQLLKNQKSLKLLFLAKIMEVENGCVWQETYTHHPSFTEPKILTFLILRIARMQNNTSYLSRDLSREVGFWKNHGTATRKLWVVHLPPFDYLFFLFVGGGGMMKHLYSGVFLLNICSHHCWRFLIPTIFWTWSNLTLSSTSGFDGFERMPNPPPLLPKKWFLKLWFC